MHTSAKNSLLFLVLSVGLCFLFLSCEPQIGGDNNALLAGSGVTAISKADAITPPLIQVNGTVKKVTVNPSSNTQYSYFVLVTTNPTLARVILLNRSGLSEGFDLYDGIPVTATGYMGTGTIGIPPRQVRGLIVTSITLEKPYITDEGTVKYIGLEGGFYGIIGTKGNYDPINLPRAFAVDGLKVRFVAKVRDDMGSIHMWGTLIEIIKIEKIDNPLYVNLDEKFMLPAGQSAVVKAEGLTFTFIEVLADSRCPRDVVCVWQGEGVISVKVNINGVDYGPYKMTTLANPSVIKVAGYAINFLELLPYPVSTDPLPRLYQGVFYITKTPVILE